MGANVLVEFENVFLIGGIFFYNWGHFVLKLGAKNNFGIEKISYFGNYMDPWFLPILHTTCINPFCNR